MNLRQVISPYPGLRPFTESEALYFKGREKHISRIQSALLETRFLMVTGASGDGKSSLIFAGLLPNVKAGFCRGEYGRWKVAVCRPGNSPFENLVGAISTQINQPVDVIENRLRYGYSGLVDLFKSSDCYVNPSLPEFIAADEVLRKKMMRKGANLLLVVDQFEEFFTASENFNRETGMPGREAGLVMNLLIETARICTEQKIPIYIVCTMRSDYIGNAPAYRGLPELIGANQFFVPRLTREELVNVIEEPLLLFGNSIEKRLVQRLINDLDVVNTDVLPCLQHALRRIWEVADNGKEKLDLKHYAKVGGVNFNELPKSDIYELNQWLETVSPKLISHLKNRQADQGISNVLNFHALELYETCHEKLNDKIEKEKCQLIIQNLFKSLTQIDDGRAVRNRSSLSDIKEALQHVSLDEKLILSVINIFREQGNSFIHPFIFDDTQSNLPDHAVIDITHEALIRNWQLLLVWTRQEFERGRDIKELKLLSNRWVADGEAKDNLLSAGQLEYFLKNFKNGIPGKIWINRYLNETLSVTDGRSEQIINNENVLNAEEVRATLITFLDESKNEIKHKHIVRKSVFGLVCVLFVLALFASIYASLEADKAKSLAAEIAKTKKANTIATLAAAQLQNDPTLSFLTAKLAIETEPTDLARNVLFSAYAKGGFYNAFKDHTDQLIDVVISPINDKFASVTSNEVIVRDFKGNLVYRLDEKITKILKSKNVAFSPDGKFLAVGLCSGEVVVIDLQSWLQQRFKVSEDQITTLVFISEKSLIFGDMLGFSGYLNVTTGNFFTRKTHEKEVSVLNFNLGRATVCIGGYDNKLIVCDTNLNELHKKTGLSLAGWIEYGVNHNGNAIAIASTSGVPLIWNFDRNVTIPLHGHSDEVWSAFFSPDDKLVITSGLDKNIKIWNAETGQCIKTIAAHSSKIWKAEFLPSGDGFYSYSDDGIIKFWSKNGDLVKEYKGHKTQIFCGDVTSDGIYFVSGSGDNAVHIWDLNPSEKTSLSGHYSWVDGVAFSPSFNKIASCGYDYSVQLWDKNGNRINRFKLHNYYGVYDVKFLTEKKLISASGDRTGVIFDTSGKIIHRLRNFGQMAFEIKINNTSDKFILRDWSPGASLWDTSANSIRYFKKAYDACFMDVDEVIFSKENNLMKWKIGNQNEALFYNHHCEIRKIEVFKSINRVLFADEKGDVWLLSGNGGNKALKVAHHDKKVSDFKLSPNQNILVSAGKDKYLHFFDVNGKLLCHKLAHSEAINSVAFSPDGKLMATGSDDFSIKLWSMVNFELVETFNVHEGAVVELMFSQDGKQILSASNDQKIGLTPISISEVLDKIFRSNIRKTIYTLTPSDKVFINLE